SWNRSDRFRREAMMRATSFSMRHCSAGKCGVGSMVPLPQRKAYRLDELRVCVCLDMVTPSDPRNSLLTLSYFCANVYGCGHGRTPQHRPHPARHVPTMSGLLYSVRNATVTGSRAAWMAGRSPPAVPMLSAHKRPCTSRLDVTRKSNATCENVLKLSVDREAPSQ